MDLESGEFTEYPAEPDNIRRVFVDNSALRRVLVGTNHHALIVKVEPLE